MRIALWIACGLTVASCTPTRAAEVCRKLIVKSQPTICALVPVDPSSLPPGVPPTARNMTRCQVNTRDVCADLDISRCTQDGTICLSEAEHEGTIVKALEEAAQ